MVTEKSTFFKRGKLFGGTVPPNNTRFGGTVPPNSALFSGTPDFDKEHIFSSIYTLFLTLRDQETQFVLRNTFGDLITASYGSHPKKGSQKVETNWG